MAFKDSYFLAGGKTPKTQMALPEMCDAPPPGNLSHLASTQVRKSCQYKRISERKEHAFRANDLGFEWKHSASQIVSVRWDCPGEQQAINLGD